MPPLPGSDAGAAILDKSTYILGETLGVGSCGTVYRARLRTPVAGLPTVAAIKTVCMRKAGADNVLEEVGAVALAI